MKQLGKVINFGFALWIATQIVNAPTAHAQVLGVLRNVVSVNDPHLFLTPENWVYGASHTKLTTNCPGAYFKIGFTGSSFEMVLDTSRNTIPDELPKIGFQIDDQPIQYAQVEQVGRSVRLILVSGLQDAPHKIKISLEGLGNVDRWNQPQDLLIVKNFFIDLGAIVFSPGLASKRMVVYGDSITEGASTLGKLNSVANKQWSTTWDAVLADKLDAEVSVIAYQAQGYHKPGQGNVPPFPQAYSFIRANQPRYFSKPDYVLVNQGTNGNASVLEVLGMMTELRKSYPKAKIYFVVPFGTAARQSIHLAYDLRKIFDLRLHLLDLGFTGEAIVATHTFDRTHPTPTGHAQLAKLLYRKMKRAW